MVEKLTHDSSEKCEGTNFYSCCSWCITGQCNVLYLEKSTAFTYSTWAHRFSTHGVWLIGGDMNSKIKKRDSNRTSYNEEGNRNGQLLLDLLTNCELVRLTHMLQWTLEIYLDKWQTHTAGLHNDEPKVAKQHKELWSLQFLWINRFLSQESYYETAAQSVSQQVKKLHSAVWLVTANQ